MSHTLTQDSPTEYTLLCAIPQQEFSHYLQQATKEFANEMRLNGFRPGKIPPDLVEREMGKEKITERATRLAVVETYAEAIKAQPFDVVETPRIEILSHDPDADIRWRAKLTVLPHFTIPDYQTVVRGTEKKTVVATPEELERALTYLRASRAKTQPVERTAQQGDLVEVDIAGTLDGSPVQELESKNHPLVLGDGKLLPSFENELVGMRKNETKHFALTMPSDDRRERIRARSVDFTVTMNIVQSRTVPEPTDDFARSLGNFESYAALRSNVNEGLVREKEEKERERFRIAMLTDICNHASITVPDVMVKREMDTMFNELLKNIQEMGFDKEAYFQHIGKTAEELKSGWKEDAERRVRFALVMRAISEYEKIDITPEEIETSANALIARFSDAAEAQKKLASEDIREYARGIVRNEKIFQRLEFYNSQS